MPSVKAPPQMVCLSVSHSTHYLGTVLYTLVWFSPVLYLPLLPNVSNYHIMFLTCVFLPSSQWPWPREIGLWGVRLVHVWVSAGLGALISQDDCCWQKLWVITLLLQYLFIFCTYGCIFRKKKLLYYIFTHSVKDFTFFLLVDSCGTFAVNSKLLVCKVIPSFSI